MATTAGAIRTRAKISRPRLRTLGIIALIVWPWLVSEQPWSNMAVGAGILTLSVLSLVVLTGWVGQISLAQAGIMGVGAFTAAQAANHIGIDFPFHIPIAGLAGALVAVLIGLPALRIRGLYLAIATLAFQWMLQASLLQWHWFSGGFNGVPIKAPHMATYDFSHERLLYYGAWIPAILLILLASNLRDSATGRAWFAIRGSEIAAKTMGVNVTRYKLLAFAVSGFIIGVAGSLKLNLITQATPLDYYFDRSILFLALAVLGGIGSTAGAMIIGIFYVFLNDWVFGQHLASFADKVPIIAALLLIVTVLRNPGGLAAAREAFIEERLVKRARKRARNAPAISGAEEPSTPAESPRPVSRLAERLAARGERTQRSDSPALLEVQEVTVRFGGVVANDHVSLEVRHGEITGLIGPNGAGKTTLFNTINGLVRPNEGRILFSGTDITELPAHRRAELGMSRTFQIMRLFPRLSVFENVMIGTHLQNGSGFASHMLLLRRSLSEDARLRERVHDTLSFLGIEDLADRRVAGLPFGNLRLVELARAMVASPKLLLLDEPASGLDESETDAFADHLLHIREEMGPTILLIEHDMRLVMMVSDYVNVLDFGKNLAAGLPADVQSDQNVISAYLGGEAIALG